MSRLKIAIAQFDFVVGAISANLSCAKKAVADAREQGADLVVLPELAITGYPPEDLLHRPGFIRYSQQAVTELQAACTGIDVIVCHPWQDGDNLYTMAGTMGAAVPMGLGVALSAPDKQAVPISIRWALSFMNC